MARKRTRRRTTRIVKIPQAYLQVLEFGHLLFPALYQFENGLRLAIHHHLTVCYGEDWWEISLQRQLPAVHEYVEKQRSRMSSMPWIGASTRVKVLPVHLVTLGHLEQIVRKYRSDCIPELFPTIEFFLGHMEVVKRVRNLYTHMFPCVTRSDCDVARREIRTLATHINSKLLDLGVTS